MPQARRFIVKGRVQGVWFRDSTRKRANALALTGHAVNLPDGDVEVLACGERAALAELEAWLRRGPPMAHVEQLVAEDAAWQELAAFTIG